MESSVFGEDLRTSKRHFRREQRTGGGVWTPARTYPGGGLGTFQIWITSPKCHMVGFPLLRCSAVHPSLSIVLSHGTSFLPRRHHPQRCQIKVLVPNISTAAAEVPLLSSVFLLFLLGSGSSLQVQLSPKEAMVSP